jgi:O-antigen/teichoic acid export membrane protein
MLREYQYALGSSVPAAVNGHYVATLNIPPTPNLVTFVLTSVLIPSIARAIAGGDRDTAGRLVLGTTRLLAVLVLPACALIASSAGDLMALLFSEEFRPGAGYFALLIFAQRLGLTFLMGRGVIMRVLRRVEIFPGRNSLAPGHPS